MSNKTRASAPGPVEVQAGRAAAAPQLANFPGGRRLRVDRPHAECSALRGPLAWIEYVRPPLYTWSASERAVDSPLATPEVTAAEPQFVSRQPGSQPVLPAPERDRDNRTGLHRQRFYPEQWRRLQQPMIERLVAAHGQRLRWIGWERSLPKLYLPAGELTRVLLDLLQVTLRQAPANDAREEELSLRVAWQIGVTQALVLVLEHPQFELPSTVMQQLNAPVGLAAGCTQDLLEASELARIRSVLRALGGTITASRGGRGGTQFRLSVPVDDRTTLVRAWLEQAAHGAIPIEALLPAAAVSMALAGQAERGRAIYQSQVSLHVVGRRQAETLTALSRADARLQALASSGDFVYRAARSRWLWLTTHSGLPRLEPHDAWQTQLISRWNCLAQPTLLTEQHTAAFHGLARAIVSQMDQVLGRRVPPLDMLIAPPPRSRRLRVDAPAASLPRRPLQRPAHASLGVAATPSMRRRRWRYPI